MNPASYITQALSLYAFKDPTYALIRHNENQTYKVTDAGGQYVLRIHQPIQGFSNEFLQDGHRPAEKIQSAAKRISPSL